jgi:hypothetical protein
VCQTRPTSLSVLNPLCTSHLSGHFTVNVLCYACLCNILWDVFFLHIRICCWCDRILAKLRLCRLVHISLYVPAWSSTSVITWRGGSHRRTALQLLGSSSCRLIWPDMVVSNFLSSVLLTFYLTLCHCMSLQVWSSWCGSNTPHCRFYQMCCYSPKSPVGLIRHIFQPCLPWQSIFQSQSKSFDLVSQL